MKLVTFNIRYCTFDDGINYQALRRPFIRQKLLKERPAVIGFQEMDEDSHRAMRGSLPGYGSVGYGNGADFHGEANYVFYDAARLELHAFDQICLSPEPRTPGSRYPDQSTCPRCAVWAKLLDTETGHRFYVVNAHLDHIGQHAIFAGMEDILNLCRRLREEEDLPLFAMGDWNFDMAAAPYTLIRKSDLYDLTAHLPSTFHDFGRETKPNKCDYILSSIPQSSRAVLWEDKTENGVYLSDHYPVAVEVSLG